MNKSLLIFLLGVIILLTFQAKVIMPIAEDVASSGIFLEDTGDEENRVSSINAMTNAAYQQCNTYITNELDTDLMLTFTEMPLNAFSLGGFQYVINADIEISPPDSASYNRRYVCRIKYLNGADKTEINNPESWEITGISGIDEL